MKIAILPGDGIGAEVTKEAEKVLKTVSDLFGLEVATEHFPVGGEAIRATGSPLPPETLNGCLSSDAVILGAVGSPEYDHLLPEERPEIGLLKLRQHLGGFANIRPAKAFPSLIDSSPLRPEIFEGTDLIIVRELLGGIYFGEPRGFSEDRSTGFNTLSYSQSEVERVAKIAFDLARGRTKKVTSVDKANVLESSRLWRETVERVAVGYPDVELDHLFVDACAMHLVTNPGRFDIVLTGNLFGDILSDEAAVLTGSLGMLASATIGGEVDLYEPVHGSAPDIEGKGSANPLGAIGCLAMCLRETFKNENAADTVEKAIENVLTRGYRTADIVKHHSDQEISTDEMGNLVCEEVVEQANFAQAYHAV